VGNDVRVQAGAAHAGGVLLSVERRWVCPNCDFTDVTYEPEVHSRFHNCRGLRGLSAPMVPAGTKAKVETHEREDYVGKEHVQTDGEGRPVMSIVTTRDEGQDCAVLAPVVTADFKEN
jgi:hypothetical protein